MKKFRLIAALSSVICMSFVFGACSATEVVDTVIEGGQDAIETSSAETEISSEDVKTVNTNLEQPAFFYDLTTSTNFAAGTEYPLDGTAVVTDGGEVTYQWYKNNVNSNGGGTPIDGATSAVYTPDTSTAGTTYYYVVATNNHGDEINNSTSSVACMNVIPHGGLTLDETGTAYKYIYDDGNWATNMWLNINGDIFCLDVNGYLTTGWVEKDGIYYYFNEYGVLAPNAVSYDGYATDEYGRRIG